MITFWVQQTCNVWLLAHLPATPQPTPGWETRTGPAWSCVSSLERWPGRCWSKTEGSHTACQRNSYFKHSLQHFVLRFVPRYSQNVHDDTQGPHVTWLVIFLWAQNLWSLSATNRISVIKTNKKQKCYRRWESRRVYLHALLSGWLTHVVRCVTGGQ